LPTWQAITAALIEGMKLGNKAKCVAYVDDEYNDGWIDGFQCAKTELLYQLSEVTYVSEPVRRLLVDLVQSIDESTDED
jgi:hypothetical protein